MVSTDSVTLASTSAHTTYITVIAILLIMILPSASHIDSIICAFCIKNNTEGNIRIVFIVFSYFR